MKWVILVIAVCLGGYTFLTLHYRKQGPAFRPYEDIQKRANVVRLLSAGYQRIPITADRPADGNRTHGGATISPAPGGLPAELRSTLVITPLLPTEILELTAAPRATAAQPYALQFTCSLPNDKQQLHGADLYVHGDRLVLVPTFEYMGGDLLTRSRAAAVLITIPGGTLKAGDYQVTLVAERASKTWALALH
jgi:hypothetical protein